MSFCRECGTKLENGFTFCPECGTAQLQSTANQPAPAPESNSAVPEVAIDWKKTGTSTVSWIKRNKWLCIIVVAVIAILAGLYGVGSYLTDGERYIAKFEKAAKDGKVEVLASMITSNNSSLTMDKDSIAPLADYLKDESTRKSIVSDLQDQAKLLAKKNTVNTDIENIYYRSAIHLKKEGKQLLIFDGYKLVVQPVYVGVSTNYKGTTISANGKKVKTTTEDYFYDKLGPFVPGQYVFTAKLDNDFSNLKAEEKITLTPANYDSIELELDGDYLTISSNYNDAIVFINDKSTEKTVDDFQSAGPFLLDGSNQVHLEREFPWGTVKGESVPIDTDYIRIELDPKNDDLKESVQNAVRNFYIEVTAAMNTKDASMASHMSDEVKGSLIESIQENLSEVSDYEVTLIKLGFDMNSLRYYDYNYDEAKYEASIDVQATMKFSATEGGETASEDLTEALRCTLSYENNQWIITDAYNIYWFDSGNVEDVLL